MALDDLLQSAVEGNPNEFQTQFKKELRGRLETALQDKKKDMAVNLFNKERKDE